DLYYRLNVVAIQLSRLAERCQDIPELVQHFLQTRRVGPTPFTITSEALEALAQYPWPGNIRELANVLERAQILAEDQTITLADLPENMADLRSSVRGASPAAPNSLREVERRHVLAMLRQEKRN